MNTEQLQSRHLGAISSRVFADAYTSVANEPSATITGEKEAASACTAITIEEMKEFAEWIAQNAFDYTTAQRLFDEDLKEGQWLMSGGTKVLTTDKLINLYLNRKK